MTLSTDDDRHLREELVESTVAFDGHFFKVRSDTVRLPDGEKAPRQYVSHPGAVTIVAVREDGRILLERQYRHPLRRVLLELPAGKLDPGEAPLETGQRELLEETGYRAGRWTALGCMTPCVGYSDELLWYFLAEDLEFAGQQLDEGELIEVVEFSPQEFEAAIRDGRITDSKTITGWTLWQLHQRPPQP